MPEGYYSFGTYLRNRYGMKVYKVPVNIPVTCPNRDGTKGTGGCIFCGEEGAGAEMLPSSMGIGIQIERNMAFLREKYKAEGFIIYLQNFTSTYLPFEEFKKTIYEIVNDRPGVVALYISTRPDCVSDEQLDLLESIQARRGLDIVLELGLQTSNEDTLRTLNRGHSVGCFIDSAERIHGKGIGVCAHIILDLPYDDIGDVINTAGLLNSLGIEQVKCHSLYVVKGTKLAGMYEKGDFRPIPYERFLERAVAFIRHSGKGLVFQRIVGRAPRETTIFCNWGKSWWRIRDEICDIMAEKGFSQGDLI